jgi:hypothetical protein
MPTVEEMSISELRRWLVRRDQDADDPASLLFPILDLHHLDEARVILEDKVDQRDFRLKVASVIAASLLGLGGLGLAIAQFFAG